MMGFALLFALCISAVMDSGTSSADTIIGVFSSTGLALGIVLLSASGGFAKYSGYLIGDILTVQPAEIAMKWRDDIIVDISRAFLDTNGVTQKNSVTIEAVDPTRYYRNLVPESLKNKPLAKAFLENLSRMEVCSQKGLAERFDASIGAATVLMPFAGKYQLTPEEAMAAKIPVLHGETDDATAMMKNTIDLMPAMELKSIVSLVKMIEPQTSVSYGRKYISKRPVKIATVPIGYADGYPRHLYIKASMSRYSSVRDAFNIFLPSSSISCLVFINPPVKKSPSVPYPQTALSDNSSIWHTAPFSCPQKRGGCHHAKCSDPTVSAAKEILYLLSDPV